MDFLYGRGTAVFDGCTIHSVDRGSDTNNGYIVAPSTKSSNPYGFLITNSTLTSDAAPGSVSLGRPWFASSDADAHPLAVIRDSVLGNHIAVQGWADMSGHAWTEGSTRGASGWSRASSPGTTPLSWPRAFLLAGLSGISVAPALTKPAPGSTDGTSASSTPTTGPIRTKHWHRKSWEHPAPTCLLNLPRRHAG